MLGQLLVGVKMEEVLEQVVLVVGVQEVLNGNWSKGLATRSNLVLLLDAGGERVSYSEITVV